MWSITENELQMNYISFTPKFIEIYFQVFQRTLLLIHTMARI